jgi:hypothetical protein
VKSVHPRNALATVVVLLGAAAIVAPVAAQTKIDKPKRDRADFVRGNENSKAKRVTPPKNEQEAVARKRTVARGVLELQLPEDRMVNLVAVRNADGTVSYQHLAEGQTLPAQASQGEVK